MHETPTVLLDKLPLQYDEVVHLIVRSAKQIGLADELTSKKTLFIKPNLTYSHYKKGVTTRAEFVRALVQALLELNSQTKIYIGEGEGGYNSFSMTKAMEKMGFYSIASDFGNVSILNLSAMPVREVQLEAFGKPYPLALPEVFYSDIDFSITCPLPKVHCMTKLTLAFKNQWGCLPDTMRLKNHYVFEEIISQVNRELKFKYAFLEGKFGLDNNGPMAGDPVEVNWFAAANSIGAFDMVLAEMMGTNWKTIGHINNAKKFGLLPERDTVRVIGDLERLKRKFILRRNAWNYPALAAFHSKKLTHLFYFSRYAKILHDIMYTFRKRPL